MSLITFRTLMPKCSANCFGVSVAAGIGLAIGLPLAPVAARSDHCAGVFNIRWEPDVVTTGVFRGGRDVLAAEQLEELVVAQSQKIGDSL
jgi:hypothetical protein